MSDRRRPKKKSRWEGRLLAALVYPANLILGGLAALILSLGIITILPAAIALARAFADWTHSGNDGVFTNTFRQFADTWRRSWLLGVGATVVAAVVIVDLVFLAYQLSEGGSAFGVIAGAAMLPMAVFCLVFSLAITAAAARLSDATAQDWLKDAARTILSMPLRSFGVLAVTTATAAFGVLLPTMIPFIALAVPVYAAVRLWIPRSSVRAQ